jgi:NADPH:quinone reductase-like Zn-dependent oxidoreductase
MLTVGIDYDGGWAQYTIAREDTLIPIPDSLPFDQAAIIPDAVSTPYAAVSTPSSPPQASVPPSPSASGAWAEWARTTCASPAWSAPRRSSP